MENRHLGARRGGSGKSKRDQLQSNCTVMAGVMVGGSGVREVGVERRGQALDGH